MEIGIIYAIHHHCDVVSTVDLVCEYLVRVEDCIVGIVYGMTPEQEPIVQGIVSILVCFNMKYSRLIMGMDRLMTRLIKRVRRHRRVGPVYRNRQVGVRMVYASKDTMAQIIG